ncbi:MAG: SusC/RagA family TonB-linked outer membrane protein [Bacteroidia bacterium]
MLLPVKILPQILLRIAVFLFLQFYFWGIVPAKSVYAQKDWEMVFISIHMKDASLVNVFDELERKTGFSFAYDEKVKSHPETYNLEYANEDVKTVLEGLAQQANLKIRLINNTISVVVKPRKQPVQKIVVLSPADVFRQVSGVVTDAESGNPLPGVTVLISGTQRGVLTNDNGRFTLDVPDGATTLVFSYVGYKRLEVPVEGLSEINVAMEIDELTLEEVVVIGYGTIQKRDLTGSVYSVKAEEINKIPVANALQGLQGKVPGVQISSVSGDPGENPVVRIRGIATFLGGASPVFVVDGVILDDISFLNSGDIESVEVLKDASATAIYGTRGANGVIIITTKRGKQGKPSFQVGASFSMESVSNRIELLDGKEFGAAVNEIEPGTYNNLDVLPNTDWQDLIFQDLAPIEKYELSVSGASERSTYYVGGSYYSQKGVIEKSDYERIAVKMNNSYDVSKFLTIGNNLTISRENKNRAPNVVASAYRAWPISVPYDDQGNFAEVNGSGNPLASLEYTNSNEKKVRAVGNFYADLTFLKDFTFHTSYQLDLTGLQATSFTPVFFVSPTQENDINDLFKSARVERSWIWENTLNYHKDFENHRIDILAGYSAQDTKREGLAATVEDLLRESPQLWYIDAGDATSIDAFNNAESYSYISYLFRANYTLFDKYLFTATYRRDGSSKFGVNDRYGDFPSFAVGWRVKEESFLKEVKWLSNLKIRASWGINGNDKIPYQARFARVSSSGLEAVFGTDEQLVPGATLSDAGNPDLKWEQTETVDAGLEFGFFDNRLTGEIDYYNKQTSQVLVPLLLPAHFGNGPFRRVVFNAADVQNKGFEFYLNWKHAVGDFRYSIGLLGSTVKNRVIEIGAADEFIQDGSLGNGQLVTRTEKGLPVGAFFGYQVIGVIQNRNNFRHSRPYRDRESVIFCIRIPTWTEPSRLMTGCFWAHTFLIC